MTRLVLCAGSTRTAAIAGISAAGADADLLAHTPSADAEILTYGHPVRAPVVPVSPTGCPTPAVVTRAVLERLHVDVDATVVDAGLEAPTGAPTVTVGASTGDDIRERDPVPCAAGTYAEARQLGRTLPDDELFLAETIPGGTTTALGVLTALGETSVLAADRATDRPDDPDEPDGPDVLDPAVPEGAVSSSLPENPLSLKRDVVATALEASSLAPGAAADEPLVALRRAGDPVLAVVAGLAAGAMETDTAVTLAGGTQLVAAAACLRHGGSDGPLGLATTSFVAADPAIDLEGAGDALDLSVTVTDPGFTGEHPATAAYLAGEAKEGVGMGGSLALAERAGLPMADVRVGVREVADRLLETDDATTGVASGRNAVGDDGDDGEVPGA